MQRGREPSPSAQVLRFAACVVSLMSTLASAVLKDPRRTNETYLKEFWGVY